MAVIISNTDPIPTNTAPQANNDTSWMQDLIVEQKPEIITETSPTIQVAEKPVVIVQETSKSAQTIQNIEPKETATTVVEEPKKDPMITNMYIAADQANHEPSSPKEPIADTPTKSVETKPTNAKAIDLDELFGNTKTTETISSESPKEQPIATNTAE